MCVLPIYKHKYLQFSPRMRVLPVIAGQAPDCEKENPPDYTISSVQAMLSVCLWLGLRYASLATRVGSVAGIGKRLSTGIGDDRSEQPFRDGRRQLAT